MARWVMVEGPPRHGRAAAFGATILLVLAVAVGVSIGLALVKAYDAAQIDEIAKEFRDPIAAPAAGPATLPT
jgi:hypothetical protein